MERKLRLKVNGEDIEVFADPIKPLLNLLREDLSIFGPKEGCGKGECGACTVLLDGKPVTSCLVPSFQAEGREVTTVEGLLNREEFIYLEEAFIEEGAIQCGFCIPGYLVTSYYLMTLDHEPNGEEIRDALSGNLCRCTGYSKILKAVEVALERKKTLLKP